MELAGYPLSIPHSCHGGGGGALLFSREDTCFVGALQNRIDPHLQLIRD